MAKFAVVDHASHNVLGEYSTQAQAEELRARLVAADDRADKNLKIHAVEDAEAPETAAVVSIDRV
jgi:hypothetical protein